MMGAAGSPIIQIHPTRRCNLRCLHCYSSSSPDEADSLPYATVEGVIEDAHAQGYKVASFSGGEPVLYQPLGDALRCAKQYGMRTTVTSNGMLLTAARLEKLAGWVDVLAISLDGIPESHNRMRNSDEAFEKMQANLEAVRNSGIDFGFIFTLTQHNVNEVDWAARFAAEQGAKLFQIHPLEEVGRAAQILAGQRPDEIESTYAFLEAERLRRIYEHRLFIQLDIVHRDLLAQHPERFYAEKEWRKPDRLAECVTPLVVEADGTVSPFGYGFGREFALGCILDRRLRDLAPQWIDSTYGRFRELCGRVYAEACEPSDLPFLNWYELIGVRSIGASRPERSVSSKLQTVS
ncbi:MAG: radical SAM protein [Bryobacteraceae bacterium]|jgi:MoaA/NifB/PqqE/SkfB family radical SAM enzyme